jgi:hypothetical protein
MTHSRQRRLPKAVQGFVGCCTVFKMAGRKRHGCWAKPENSEMKKAGFRRLHRGRHRTIGRILRGRRHETGIRPQLGCTVAGLLSPIGCKRILIRHCGAGRRGPVELSSYGHPMRQCAAVFQSGRRQFYKAPEVNTPRAVTGAPLDVSRDYQNVKRATSWP